MDYTEGKWELYEQNEYLWGLCPEGKGDEYRIAEILRGTNSIFKIRGKEAEANAHLIAAAPSMYEALKDSIITLKVLQPQGSALIREIEQSLALAEGSMKKK